jgi:hypothetical protein
MLLHKDSSNHPDHELHQTRPEVRVLWSIYKETDTTDWPRVHTPVLSVLSPNRAHCIV